MISTPSPEFRSGRRILLAGTMAVYGSQEDAGRNIPAQWQALFERPVPELHTATVLYGASPCTADGGIHYLAGIEVANFDEGRSPARLTLEEGEYVVFTVRDVSDLRETWVWALRTWLPSSGRSERNAPEFERYMAPYNPERTSGPIEIWIPLEAQTKAID